MQPLHKPCQVTAAYHLHPCSNRANPNGIVIAPPCKIRANELTGMMIAKANVVPL